MFAMRSTSNTLSVDVLRHVETVAGHVADLLASECRGLSPDNSVVATAHEVLDACCRFIEQWNGRTTRCEAFDVDVLQWRLVAVPAQSLGGASDARSGRDCVAEIYAGNSRETHTLV